MYSSFVIDAIATVVTFQIREVFLTVRSTLLATSMVNTSTTPFKEIPCCEANHGSPLIANDNGNF